MIVVLVAAALAPVAAAGRPTRTTAGGVFVRVDQVGYPTNGPKVAYVMSEPPTGRDLLRRRGQVGDAVFTGTLGPTAKKWNARYRFVYPLSFTGLTSPGTDRISVAGPPAASSPVVLHRGASRRCGARVWSTR